jgi:predicted membrane metal-binding protein
VPLLVFYALITGLSASCLRACIMGAMVLAAYFFDRHPSPFNGIAAAAFAILAWDTNQLFSPGFQFSFVLVLVLLWLAERMGSSIIPLASPISSCRARSGACASGCRPASGGFPPNPRV